MDLQMTLTVRFSKRDIEVLEQRAAASDFKPGSYLRHLMREDARQAGMLKDEASVDLKKVKSGIRQ